jgi:PIN domain nuclease of toxin-antitoxin system
MNHLLLDSHILLWLVAPEAGHLTAKTRQMITGAAGVYFSIVSLWEIAIKAAKGQLDIDLDLLLEALDAAGLRELPLKREHVQALRGLPFHHRDPFDRMLVAQALAEPLHLLTSDEKLKPYGALVVVV